MVAISALVFTLATASGGQATELAEEAAARGVELHAAGRYREAAEAFLRAFELSGIHIQLRNAAKSLSEAGQTEHATRLWLKVFYHPQASRADRQEAQAFLSRLNRSPEHDVHPAGPPPALEEESGPKGPKGPKPGLEAQPPLESRLTQLMETPPKDDPGPSVAWWVVGSLSIASVVAGGLILASSRSDLGDLDAALAQRQQGRIIGVTFSAAENQLSSIRRDHAISAALLGVGGAGLLASTLGLSLDW